MYTLADSVYPHLGDLMNDNDCSYDPAHESDLRKLAREQLRLDVDVIDCDESVPYEPWPIEDLEF